LGKSVTAQIIRADGSIDDILTVDAAIVSPYELAKYVDENTNGQWEKILIQTENKKPFVCAITRAGELIDLTKG
jgi:hypothetical protein